MYASDVSRATRRAVSRSGRPPSWASSESRCRAARWSASAAWRQRRVTLLGQLGQEPPGAGHVLLQSVESGLDLAQAGGFGGEPSGLAGQLVRPDRQPGRFGLERGQVRGRGESAAFQAGGQVDDRDCRPRPVSPRSARPDRPRSPLPRPQPLPARGSPARREARTAPGDRASRRPGMGCRRPAWRRARRASRRTARGAVARLPRKGRRTPSSRRRTPPPGGCGRPAPGPARPCRPRPAGSGPPRPERQAALRRASRAWSRCRPSLGRRSRWTAASCSAAPI